MSERILYGRAIVSLFLVFLCNTAYSNPPQIAEERPHIEEDDLITEAVKALRHPNRDHFCEMYGKALRGEQLDNDGRKWAEPIEKLRLQGTAPRDIGTLVRAEAKRRKIKFDDSDVIGRRIRIGMDYCLLNASWSRIPIDVHTTVELKRSALV